MNVYGVVVVDFFVFFCGNVAFTVSKLIDDRLLKTKNTNIANKVKSRVRIKRDQDRRLVASLCQLVSLSSSSWPFAVASHAQLDDW